MNREDFLILNNDITYFDNAATTLKPKIVVDKIIEYYNNYSSNIGRSNYEIAKIANLEYEKTREEVKKFINAKDKNTIAFTNNTTDSINKIVLGYFSDYLNKDDEVLITVSEHASCILPWFNLQNKKGIKVKFIELDQNNKLTIENLKKSITNKTKVISIAHITNVVGDIRPIKEIIELAHTYNIKVLIDAAQSIGHIKIDVTDLDVDFLVFSAHKMLGPTGVGVIYTKEDVINPIILGGGMNNNFNINGKMIFDEMPYKLEAGTPNIADVIAFKEAIKYINKIGMQNITDYESYLKRYFINQLNKLDNVIIYNKTSESSIITFNVKNYESSIVSDILNENNICVRTGSHCAKVLKENLGTNDTIRISLYFYNTKDEIDKFIKIIKSIT